MDAPGDDAFYYPRPSLQQMAPQFSDEFVFRDTGERGGIIDISIPPTRTPTFASLREGRARVHPRYGPVGGNWVQTDRFMMRNPENDARGWVNVRTHTNRADMDIPRELVGQYQPTQTGGVINLAPPDPPPPDPPPGPPEDIYRPIWPERRAERYSRLTFMQRLALVRRAFERRYTQLELEPVETYWSQPPEPVNWPLVSLSDREAIAEAETFSQTISRLWSRTISRPGSIVSSLSANTSSAVTASSGSYQSLSPAEPMEMVQPEPARPRANLVRQLLGDEFESSPPARASPPAPPPSRDGPDLTNPESDAYRTSRAVIRRGKQPASLERGRWSTGKYIDGVLDDEDVVWDGERHIGLQTAREQMELRRLQGAPRSVHPELPSSFVRSESWHSRKPIRLITRAEADAWDAAVDAEQAEFYARERAATDMFVPDDAADTAPLTNAERVGGGRVAVRRPFAERIDSAMRWARYRLAVNRLEDSAGFEKMSFAEWSAMDTAMPSEGGVFRMTDALMSGVRSAEGRALGGAETGEMGMSRMLDFLDTEANTDLGAYLEWAVPRGYETPPRLANFRDGEIDTGMQRDWQRALRQRGLARPSLFDRVRANVTRVGTYTRVAPAPPELPTQGMGGRPLGGWTRPPMAGEPMPGQMPPEPPAAGEGTYYGEFDNPEFNPEFEGAYEGLEPPISEEFPEQLGPLDGYEETYAPNSQTPAQFEDWLRAQSTRNTMYARAQTALERIGGLRGAANLATWPLMGYAIGSAIDNTINLEAQRRDHEISDALANRDEASTWGALGGGTLVGLAATVAFAPIMGPFAPLAGAAIGAAAAPAVGQAAGQIAQHQAPDHRTRGMRVIDDTKKGDLHTQNVMMARTHVFLGAFTQALNPYRDEVLHVGANTHFEGITMTQEQYQQLYGPEGYQHYVFSTNTQAWEARDYDTNDALQAATHMPDARDYAHGEQDPDYYQDMMAFSRWQTRGQRTTGDFYTDLFTTGAYYYIRTEAGSTMRQLHDHIQDLIHAGTNDYVIAQEIYRYRHPEDGGAHQGGTPFDVMVRHITEGYFGQRSTTSALWQSRWDQHYHEIHDTLYAYNQAQAAQRLAAWQTQQQDQEALQNAILEYTHNMQKADLIEQMHELDYEGDKMDQLEAEQRNQEAWMQYQSDVQTAKANQAESERRVARRKRREQRDQAIQRAKQNDHETIQTVIPNKDVNTNAEDVIPSLGGFVDAAMVKHVVEMRAAIDSVWKEWRMQEARDEMYDSRLSSVKNMLTHHYGHEEVVF